MPTRLRKPDLLPHNFKLQLPPLTMLQQRNVIVESRLTRDDPSAYQEFRLWSAIVREVRQRLAGVNRGMHPVLDRFARNPGNVVVCALASAARDRAGDAIEKNYREKSSMAYFTKRYHPPGTSPGTLTRREQAQPVPLRILLMDYTDSDYSEKSLATPEECKPYLERDTVTWIHLQGDAEPETVRQLGHLFGLHNLALEDVINSGQRPKVDEYGEQLFVVMAHPIIDAGGESVSVSQLSLFLGRNFVISFHPGRDDPFDPVRKRLRDRVGRLRSRGADHLLYALIDLVIDGGFPLLEWLGDELEELEEEMLQTPTRANLRRLYELKRTLVMLRRMLWPQREAVNKLVHEETVEISGGTRIYLRDCYDHTIQIMDLIESYRDMATGLLDVYLSSVSYRLNEIMRVLTVIATIFIPLTFIVGLYGMNFRNEESPWAMPELYWYYGYPLVWLLMIVIAGGMLVYFRRRKWF